VSAVHPCNSGQSGVRSCQDFLDHESKDPDTPLLFPIPGALLSVITRKQAENGLGGLFSRDTSRV